MDKYTYLTPQQAWNALQNYRDAYYRKYVAAYSGDRNELRATSEKGLFWKRDGKAKIHMELAGDIVATSANLLFAEEPAFTSEECLKEDAKDDPRQIRLDEIVQQNNISGKLNEAAESCAVLGDVFLKIGYWQNGLDFPVLSVVQADSAWAEYVLGVLQCIHFFSIVSYDSNGDKYTRAYERYEHGKIVMKLFEGDASSLGKEISGKMLEQYGFEAEIKTPVNNIMAVHIPNMKPNRVFRWSDHGRSDLDGLRDQLDSLDEAYSSWMRDIRLGKARQIIPAEYLRRKPSELFKGDNKYTYEFDEDVETLVALDIDPDKITNPIISSQFAIRADEHAKTCADLIRNIVSEAGYAPQSFGMDIEGNAQSGSALRIREKKSEITRNKKQTYWEGPLTEIMTTLIHVDAAIYPGKGSSPTDAVDVQFADTMATDLSTMSSALEALNRAVSMSTEEKVRTLHPDWSDSDVQDEAAKIAAENGFMLPSPDMGLGDYENPNKQDDTGNGES